MKELNYQYKIIEENKVNGKLIFKVKDSIYDKIVFMELFKEISSDDWDAGYKLEDEIRALKSSGEISDYFINDDYSSGRKSYYKIYNDVSDVSDVSPEEGDEKGSRSRATTVTDVAVLHRPKEEDDEEWDDDILEEARLKSKAIRKINDAKIKQTRKDTGEIERIEQARKERKEIERIRKMSKEAFKTNSYTSPPIVEKKKSKKGLIIFIIVIGAIANFIYKEVQEKKYEIKSNKIAYKNNAKTGSNYQIAADYFEQKEYYPAERSFKKSCNYDKNKDACSMLGYIYEEKKVYKANSNKSAIKFYFKACKLKDLHSCKKGCNLDDINSCQYAGDYLINKKDFKSSIEYYTKGCTLKDGYSCLKVGYVNEVDLKNITKETMSFYEKACDLGNKIACYNFGLVHEHDKIKEGKDLVKSKKLYAKSCKLGYKKACSKSELKNIKKVKSLNIDKKDVDTKKNLAIDKKLSLKEIYNLGKKYQDNKDYFNANLFFSEACPKGHISSCEFLGWNYENGFGYTKSASIAMKYYTKACDKKSGYSCNKIAYFYETGVDVKKDIKKARAFYKKSCNFKYAIGCYGLGLIFEYGKGIRIDKKSSRFLYKKSCKLGYKKACKK